MNPVFASIDLSDVVWWEHAIHDILNIALWGFVGWRWGRRVLRKQKGLPSLREEKAAQEAREKIAKAADKALDRIEREAVAARRKLERETNRP